jgi:two-component system LytT family response regulator
MDGNRALRVVVVEDEPPARSHLLALLAEDQEITVVAACDGGAAAIAAIEETHPDLVLLDVQMPEIDGFAVIEAVGVERMPAVIFVTAFEEHALRAFEVQALDYLLKPFDRLRFQRALGRAKAEIRRGAAGLTRALGAMMQTRPVDRLLVKDGERITVVAALEVDWMQAAGNYVELHAGKQTHLLRSTLAALEARLDPASFLRIHRDTIVQVDRIHHIQRWPGGQYRVVLSDGTERPLGKSYQPRVEQRLGKL